MLRAGQRKRKTRALLVGLAQQHSGSLKGILGANRGRIIEAPTCIEAWRMVHQASFDVAVVDEESQRDHWRDLIEEIRDMGLSLPVILVSGRADERLWIDALSAGAYDVLDIPFHAEEARRILRMAAAQAQHVRNRCRRRSLTVMRRCGRVRQRPVASLVASEPASTGKRA